MSRLLIFSPYARRMHLTAYEGTMAKACSLRGCDVEYILCDGLLPECDMHWDSFPGNYARPLDLCEHCKQGARSRIEKFGLPYRWLGEFLTLQEREEAFAWAQDLPHTEILQAVFRTTPLGEWVFSSVVSYFRQYPPDMGNWHVVNVYRGFLYSAAIVTMALKNYLRQHPVDAVLLFNGRQSITRTAFEIFRDAGIRVLTHEYPFYQDGHLMLKPNARCWSPRPFEDFWRMWGNVPLTRDQLQTTLKWLRSRRYGQGLSWYAYNAPYVKRLSIRKKLRLSEDRRILALFTSSTDETVGDSELQGPYESQATWVQDVLDWVKKRTDVELVIRVHPHLSGHTGLGRAEDEFEFYRRMKSCAPANVRVVMPDDSLNSYALMDEADIGLTYGSSVGIEMALLGKPIVLGSRAFYENGSHIHTIRSREELPELLEKSLLPVSVRELRREAFRLAYYQVYRFELPFNLVKKTGVMEVELNYSGHEALAPGLDETIDHACDFLMNGGSLFDPPDEKDLARTTAEEDAFLDEFDRSAEPMRDRDYERWLVRATIMNTLGRTVQRALARLPFGIGNLLNRVGKAVYLPLLRRLQRQP